MKILFCNIAWMKYYHGNCEADRPQHGGSFVDKTNDANECSNFLPVVVEANRIFEDDVPCCFGSFETKCTRKDTQNQVHIEKIRGCGSFKNCDYADNILVIWCAKSCRDDTVVVGWYKGATVFREYQELQMQDKSNGDYFRTYNIVAKAEDCVLLPEAERFRKLWYVPRAQKKGIPFGFGRANVWYAVENSAEEYLKKIVSSINKYDGENWLYKNNDDLS